MEKCNHGNSAPEDMLRQLPDSQAGTGRHKCVVCAYAKGIEDAGTGRAYVTADLEKCDHGHSAPQKMLDKLPYSQAGTGRHRCAVCAYTKGLISGMVLQNATTSVETEQITHGINIDDFIPDEEGRKRLRTHISYERSPKNRAQAILLHGTICAACGFDFNKFYGQEFARSYIEIHHVKSIVEQEGKTVDPERDLIPLCSNCHSMAHRQKDKILTIKEIRDLIKQQPN